MNEHLKARYDLWRMMDCYSTPESGSRPFRRAINLIMFGFEAHQNMRHYAKYLYPTEWRQSVFYTQHDAATGQQTMFGEGE